MSLFVPANHMLVLYSSLYLVGDFLRAFFYKADDSADAVGISVLFFFLSIWLVLNSIIYYKVSRGTHACAFARLLWGLHVEISGDS